MSNYAPDIKELEDLHIGGASNDELSDKATEIIWRILDELVEMLRTKNYSRKDSLEKDLRDFANIGNTIQHGRNDAFKKFHEFLLSSGYILTGQDFFNDLEKAMGNP